MQLPLQAFFVVAILFITGQIDGSSDLKRFSTYLQHKFFGEVMLRIAQIHEFPSEVNLDDITLDEDELTTVVFSRIHLLEMGNKSVARIDGEYEIVSNDVEQAFPRSGHLNILFSDILKKMVLPSEVKPVISSPPSSNHTTNLDYLVDFILRIVRDTLRETKHDQIKIPDLDERFTTDIVFFPVDGRFRAFDGWFKNLSTVYRTADTIATTDGSSTISIVCSLGLHSVSFGFKHYEANLGDIEASGSIWGTGGSNSITTKISLAYVDNTCRATLNSLKVSHVSGISINLTGWDGFGWLLSFIADCATGSNKDKIIRAVEKQLYAVIEQKLSHFNCTQHFQQIMKSL